MSKTQPCPWPDCDVELPTEWDIRYTPGERMHAVDPTDGKSKHSHLSSEAAAAMGARGGDRFVKTQEAAEILKNAARSPGDIAAQDAARDFLIDIVARELVKGNITSSTLAILSQTIDEIFSKLRPPAHGKRCKLCGEVYGEKETVFNINLGLELVAKMVPRLADRIQELKHLAT